MGRGLAASQWGWLIAIRDQHALHVFEGTDVAELGFGEEGGQDFGRFFSFVRHGIRAEEAEADSIAFANSLEDDFVACHFDLEVVAFQAGVAESFLELSEVELVRFGIDRREFGETGWQPADVWHLFGASLLFAVLKQHDALWSSAVLQGCVASQADAFSGTNAKLSRVSYALPYVAS